MAKAKMNSKKGGASSHLRPCKTAYCDKHNERKDKNPSNSNIRPEFSKNNSVWKADDVPNLVTLDRQIRKDYYVAHERHMPDRGPSKASPLKEMALGARGASSPQAATIPRTARRTRDLFIINTSLDRA